MYSYDKSIQKCIYFILKTKSLDLVCTVFLNNLPPVHALLLEIFQMQPILLTSFYDF